MVFETKDFYIAHVERMDLSEIIEVYNSNRDFLMNHMDKEMVESEWMFEELDSMKKIGFQCCKIVHKSTGIIIGILDFKIDKETYLSLFMLHRDYKNKGLGKNIYQCFEKFIQSLNSRSIRIDVVNAYDNTVLDFWSRKGFIQYENIELNWTGKILSAVTMKKSL